MSFPTATLDAALGGITITQASLHTGFPGSTGINEVTGGTPAYAKKAVTFNASSGGTRLMAAAVTFDVPASTIRWVGFWNGGTFVAYAPNGGATPREFVALASDDYLYSPAHGYSDTQKVVFFNGTVPGGLVEGTVYFVRDSSADRFKVAATSGGAAIDLTSSGSSKCVVCAITEEVYAAQSTHQLSSASLDLLL